MKSLKTVSLNYFRFCFTHRQVERQAIAGLPQGAQAGSGRDRQSEPYVTFETMH